MAEAKNEKYYGTLVKCGMPIAPFNYLIEVCGYAAHMRSETPKQKAKEMQDFCIMRGKKAPKFFKFEDIRGVVTNGKPVYLVDMSYYRGDNFIQTYMWFEDVKKRY